MGWRELFAGLIPLAVAVPGGILLAVGNPYIGLALCMVAGVLQATMVAALLTRERR